MPPFETVDELRTVNGATLDIPLCEDVNLNGVLDSNENDGDVARQRSMPTAVWTREFSSTSPFQRFRIQAPTVRQLIAVNSTNLRQSWGPSFTNALGGDRANAILRRIAPTPLQEVAVAAARAPGAGRHAGRHHPQCARALQPARNERQRVCP